MLAWENESVEVERIDNLLTELSLFDTESMARAIKDLAGKHPKVFDGNWKRNWETGNQRNWKPEKLETRETGNQTRNSTRQGRSLGG